MLANLEQDYELGLPLWSALESEVSYIIKETIEVSGVKTHAIESRIKSVKSVKAKAKEKDIINPISEINDIVGVRIVTLFRFSLSEIDRMVSESFSVVSKDDKLNDGKDVFGYMSIHYVCHLKQEYSGPRYDKIKSLKFEIQVRTLCMHAWSAISHYLSYKGEWDIPAESQKSLSALSGLFYLADNEFEMAFKSRVDSVKEARQSVSRNKLFEEFINFDTMSAYLESSFPDRNRSSDEGVSDLVKEVLNFGYKTIGEIDEIVKRVDSDLLEEEKDRLEEGKKYFYLDIGAVRSSLSINDEDYAAMLRKKADERDVGRVPSRKKKKAVVQKI